MSRAILVFCVLLSSAVAADTSVFQTLGGVEKRYNSIRTLQVQFYQTYTTQGQGRRTESGTLFLRKPGRMRWDYSNPPGKFLVADGKDMYFYSPNTNRVEKTKMKESDDYRVPFAFLLGKLDFRRDFGKFYVRQEGADSWITAVPKSDRAPFTKVEFQLAADGEIRRLQIVGVDQSTMDFRFTDEQRNPSLGSKMFEFKAPPGAEVVEAMPESQP